jgi:isoleucyl-tRNA synthetase
MSKRLGNAVDPFETIGKYGPDATRWYMITNAQPWDNLKFDIEGITEVQRKFFGTLYNTYSFFTIYANIDGFRPKGLSANADRPELDRWILSRLNSLISFVKENLDDFNPTPAARAIEEFVDAHLSNWYVRLSRKRFWHGEMTADKESAYETLHHCLFVVAQLSSPFAPFFSDWLYRNLTPDQLPGRSVHLSNFPVEQREWIDAELEKRMDLAQRISSMVLSIRKKENIRVRQPLQSIRIPLLDESSRGSLEAITELVLAETNVKRLEIVTSEEANIVKNLKLNFKTLGARCGKNMKLVQNHAIENAGEIIKAIENLGEYVVPVPDGTIELHPEDVEIIPVDIPGWKVVNDGPITVALDVTISQELKNEGIARELVNRIQNLRKETGLEVTDRINVKILAHEAINEAIELNSEYIRAQILANSLEITADLPAGTDVLLEDGVETKVALEKWNQ